MLGRRPAATSRCEPLTLVAIAEPDRDARRIACDRSDRDPRAQCYPLAGEPFGEQSRELGVVARQQRAEIEHGDLRAEPAMRLRHLDADRPAADHDQMLGQFTVGKHGLVGQIGHLVEPGDRRRHRVRAGGDHEPAGADLDLAGQHRARAGETRRGAQHGDAQTLEPLRRIVRRELAITWATLSPTAAKSTLRQRVGNAELRRAPPQLGAPSGGEQGFRRDAAEIQAVAAHRSRARPAPPRRRAAPPRRQPRARRRRRRRRTDRG